MIRCFSSLYSPSSTQIKILKLHRFMFIDTFLCRHAAGFRNGRTDRRRCADGVVRDGDSRRWDDDLGVFHPNVSCRWFSVLCRLCRPSGDGSVSRAAANCGYQVTQQQNVNFSEVKSARKVHPCLYENDDKTTSTQTSKNVKQKKNKMPRIKQQNIKQDKIK